MALRAQYWETNLRDLAYQALESGVTSHFSTDTDRISLSNAYQQCAEITRENSKTFFMASSLLPGKKRLATRALYAFCRVSDDLVDLSTGGSAAVLECLEGWRQQVVHGLPFAEDHPGPLFRVVSLAWADARRNYHIPRGYVDQLIDGLALDLDHHRYDSFADLSRYCYGVACTVGLMSMHITGYSDRAAIPYAIRLGVALQLTNILRDVGEDWRSGRLYLPQDELREFGLSEEDIASGRVDKRWRSFMSFQIHRARQLYDEALPGVGYLHPDGRFAIAAAGELYRAILDQIEANDYDVFTRRAAVSKWGKLSRLPGIWLRTLV